MDLQQLAERCGVAGDEAALASFAAAVRTHAMTEACETIRKLAALPKPTVAAAAVRNEDGTIHQLPPPAGHMHVITDMVRHGKAPDGDAVRGFVLSDGRFVLPDEAARVALAAGQLKTPPVGGYLFPEDIWPR